MGYSYGVAIATCQHYRLLSVVLAVLSAEKSTTKLCPLGIRWTCEASVASPVQVRLGSQEKEEDF